MRTKTQLFSSMTVFMAGGIASFNSLVWIKIIGFFGLLGGVAFFLDYFFHLEPRKIENGMVVKMYDSFYKLENGKRLKIADLKTLKSFGYKDFEDPKIKSINARFLSKYPSEE